MVKYENARIRKVTYFLFRHFFVIRLVNQEKLCIMNSICQRKAQLGLSVLFVFILIFSSSCDKSEQIDLVESNSIYEGEDGFNIIQLEQGDYLIAGRRKSNIQEERSQLLKISEEGVQLSSTQVPFHFYFGRFLIKDKDENTYLISEDINTPSNDRILLLKISNEGAVISSKDIGVNLNPNSMDVINTSDNAILVFLSTQTNSQPPNYNPYLSLVKIDLEGNLIWQRNYEFDKGVTGENVIETSDGGFLITSRYDSSNEITEGDILYLKVDNSGLEVWNKKFGVAGKRENARWTVEKNNNQPNFISMGFTLEEQNGEIVRTLNIFEFNQSLGKIWQTNWRGEGNVNPLSMIKTSTGDLVITGGTNPTGSSQGNIFVLKTTIDGEELWSNIIGKDGREDHGYFIMEDKNGDYLVTGKAESFDDPNGHSLFFSKISTDGTIIY